jgi:hypothetical protein
MGPLEAPAGGPEAWRHCPGCGRPTAECAGCVDAFEPRRFCAACGRRLTVQVTPTGWDASCRACGAIRSSRHGSTTGD